MKFFRYLSLCLLVCGLTQASYAFKLGVLDPHSATYYYTGTPLDISFSPCGHHKGCATIANDSGATLTSLVIDVPATDLASQTSIDCTTTNGLFSACSVSEIDGNSEYQFDFTGGDIPVNDDGVSCDPDTFKIEEQGVPAEDITAMVDPAIAPEPASIWLLSSGILLLAGFLYRRRLLSGPIGTPIGS